MTIDQEERRMKRELITIFKMMESEIEALSERAEKENWSAERFQSEIDRIAGVR